MNVKKELIKLRTSTEFKAIITTTSAVANENLELTKVQWKIL